MTPPGLSRPVPINFFDIGYRQRRIVQKLTRAVKVKYGNTPSRYSSYEMKTRDVSFGSVSLSDNCGGGGGGSLEGTLVVFITDAATENTFVLQKNM